MNIYLIKWVYYIDIQDKKLISCISTGRKIIASNFLSIQYFQYLLNINAYIYETISYYIPYILNIYLI